MGSFAETSFQFPTGLNTNGFGVANGFNAGCHQSVQIPAAPCGWHQNNGTAALETNPMHWGVQEHSSILASCGPNGAVKIPPPFTNGRKRSCDAFNLEDTKKVKTEVGMETEYPPNFSGYNCPVGGYPTMISQNGQPGPNAVSTPQVFQPQIQRQASYCFPTSVIEHQSMMYAERNYDVSLLESLVAEFHGC